MIVYVDMDGVLADFDKAVFEKLNLVKPAKSVIFREIQYYNDNIEPWFETLDIMEGAIYLWDEINKLFPKVEILTAKGSSIMDADIQKTNWIREHISRKTRINIVEKSADKSVFASSASILVDDRSKAINPFIAAGGVGILHTNVEKTLIELEKLISSKV